MKARKIIIDKEEAVRLWPLMMMKMDFYLSCWEAGVEFSRFNSVLSFIQANNFNSMAEEIYAAYEMLDFERIVREKNLNGSNAEKFFLFIKEAFIEEQKHRELKEKDN
jgi:hypothetical protein